MTGATAAFFISGPLQQNPVALGPRRPACQARTIARARRQPNGGPDFHGQAGGDCRDCRIDTLPRHRRDLGAGDNAPPMRILQQVNRPIASRTGAPGNRPGARLRVGGMQLASEAGAALFPDFAVEPRSDDVAVPLARLGEGLDRKSTRLNSSHRCISYAVFCLKKKIYNSSRTGLRPAETLSEEPC